MKTVREEYQEFRGDYIRHYNAFARYCLEKIGREPEWSDFTDERLKDYRYWLSSRYSNSTVQSYCASLRLFLDEHKELVPSKMYVIDLLVKKDNVLVRHNDFCLLDYEVEQLEAYEPSSDNERYIKALFFVMLHTGADARDARIFSKNNIIEGSKRLFYTSEQTGIDVSLPLTDKMRKYIYELEKTKHTSSLLPTHESRYLHFICKKAGLQRVMEYGKPLYDIINMKTARKTFATKMSYKYTEDSVREMMGLKTIYNLTKYIVGYQNKYKKKHHIAI